MIKLTTTDTSIHMQGYKSNPLINEIKITTSLSLIVLELAVPFLVSVCFHTSNILVPQKLSLQDIRITILGARTTFLNSCAISSPILSGKDMHRLIFF